MDSLSYKYNRDVNGNLVNNRLNHVRDAVNSSNYAVDIDDQSANNYGYDRIGNLKIDIAEKIGNINWTVYGKIKQVDKNEGSDISYGYDAGGNRTSKIVGGTADTITFYIRDAQGNVLAIYSKRGTENLKWDEQHLYGSSRLGMWRWDTLVPTAAPVVGGATSIYDSLLLGSRSYELSNHLGNVLSTVSDKKIGNDSSGVVNYYLAEVLSQNDYYPFGMLMPGRKYAAEGGYRYGFNGKENDNEVKGEGNQQDYGMRIYDTRLSRFLSVDPLTKGYPHYTPYSYAGNKPIKFIDLDGGEEKEHWYDYNFADLMNWLGSSDNSLQNINRGQGPIGEKLDIFNRSINPVGVVGYNGYTVITARDLERPGKFSRVDATVNLVAQYIFHRSISIASKPTSAIVKLEGEMAKNKNIIGNEKPKIEEPAIQITNEEAESIKAYVKQQSSSGNPITLKNVKVDDIKEMISTEPDAQSLVKVLDIKKAIDSYDPFVWSEPVFTTTYKGKTYILDGHNRLSAAIKSSNKNPVPVTELSTEKAKQMFRDKMTHIEAGNFKQKINP